MSFSCVSRVAPLGFTAASLVVVTLPAWAQPAGPADIGGTGAAALDSIQVTANRVPQRESEALAATTVITRDDIERLQARSVSDLLRRSPGVSITNNGGPGKATSIFLRGTESDHTLLLVDGVEYRSATTGQPAIEDLPVDQIERIEIVRGPRSSLYGSEAIGGVIQVFTRSGEGRSGSRPYARIGAGSYDTVEGQVGVSGGDGKTHYNLSVSGTQSNGFDACSGDAAGVGSCFNDEPDDDGYDRLTGALRFGHTFANGVDFDLSFLRAQGSVEFDGNSQNESDTVQQVIGTSLSWRPVAVWRTEVSYGHNRDESENFIDDAYTSAFDTERHKLGWQNDVTLPNDDLVTLGADYEHESVDGDSDGDFRNDFTGATSEDTRDNVGVFAQYLGDVGRHHFKLSGRYDDNEQFGEQVTGSAAYGIDFLDHYTASLSYGTAFKAPTFNELYFPGFGNPDLEPEESESFEIGLDADYDWGVASLHAFQTDIDDLIAFDSATFSPNNVAETRIQGLEGSLGTTLGAWQIAAQATLLDTENRGAGPNQGNELQRRPEQSYQIDVDRSIGRFGIGASVAHDSSTFDDLANQNELDSYTRIDLRGEMALAGAWTVQTKLNNVFDEDYETARFYNQPDRNVFVTLRYQPQ